VSAFWILTRTTQAQEFELESVGVRWGFSSVHATKDFNQTDAFLNWRLPWSWDLDSDSDWRLQSRLDLAAGWVGGNGDDSFIAKAGPTLVLRFRRWPISLEGGVGPTIMAHDKFGPKDLGSRFQFTTHAGLNCDLGVHLRIGYRYEHISNAGLATPNPGLNFHVFGMSYVF
jgi:hypothetical protein